MTRRTYPKPPIVEAVVEITFIGEPKGEQALEALGAALASQYPGERRQQEVVEMSAEVSPSSVATATRRTPHVTFLRSADGTRLIGCGARTMSVHQLAPYGGWETFLEQIEEAVAALPEAVRKEGVAALSVRYIDRIILPEGQESFADFITIMPPCPAPLPSGLSAFHVVTQTNDPADKTVALLTLASAAPTADGNPVILYDLHFRREGTPLCGLEDRTWVTIVEDLHKRQRDVFEASVTDRMRELFR